MSPATLPVPLSQFAPSQIPLALPPSPSAREHISYLPVPNPSKSFWIDTPGSNPLASHGSQGELLGDADVVIIGAGITGVGVAWHLSQLAKQRLKVVILDARDFCSGATGRNGGHLTPSAFLSFSSHRALYGTDEALASIALEHHTVNSLLSIIKHHSLQKEVDLAGGGHVTLLFTQAEVEEAKRDWEEAKEAGVHLGGCEWLGSEQMREVYGATYPGIKIPGNNLWPLKLVTNLYNLASASSSIDLTLHTRTPVTSIKHINTSSKSLSRRYEVQTPRGPVKCRYVVHATNAYAAHLLPHYAGPKGIIPTRGQVTSLLSPTLPLSKMGKVGWGGNEGFEYWFVRPTGEVAGEAIADKKGDGPRREKDGNRKAERTPLVILGGGRETTGPTYETYMVDDSVVNPVVSEALRGFLGAVFPTEGGGENRARGEGEGEGEMEWTGIMGFTKTGDPFVGPIYDTNHSLDTFRGQYIAAGYTGHGMPRAFGCAEALAQMLIADLEGKEWVRPGWLPRRYLTSERL
ncbi:hypothetical protein JAAARDRAFT_66961 [Jaapia argillacea MUCL 33604]|uniref:FAD dependent oxidoreductase domain-containing protein n=1 Tax=Jaapia argillacea MUCL 33604 TaxID=933084 RepID=A0A067QHC5_9AGAM|nr:hypothetical protein JAAARDRAFT_66961 [Jaapia argillacea MUCL 33604]